MHSLILNQAALSNKRVSLEREEINQKFNTSLDDMRHHLEKQMLICKEQVCNAHVLPIQQHESYFSVNIYVSNQIRQNYITALLTIFPVAYPRPHLIPISFLVN